MNESTSNPAQVTVFGSETCANCKTTIKILDSKNIDYRYIDVTNNPDATDELRSLGFTQLPVVQTPGRIWSGIRYDLLAEVK